MVASRPIPPAGAGGGSSPPTTNGGFTTGATVGEVSITKLAPPVKDGWEWWLASTSYGQAPGRFCRLNRLAGSPWVVFLNVTRKVGGLFL